MLPRLPTPTLLLLACAILLTTDRTNALDVEVVETTCDESLPVTAQLYLNCAAGSRCTFGNTTLVTGSVTYNGLSTSGIENNVGYMTADLSLWSLHFNLVDMMQVPLCDESMVADANNQNECPGDGTHKYEFEYTLPKAGTEYTSWLASGWKGSGLIQIFAEQNENMKIGECKLSLNTYVTRKSSEKSLIGTPSAATSLGILVALLVVLAGLGMYCYCCCGKNKRPKKMAKNKVQAMTYTANDDDDGDDAAHFKRMEDEKSFWSGSKKSKKSASTAKDSSNSVVSDML